MQSDTAVVILGMRVGLGGPREELAGRIKVAMSVASRIDPEYIVLTGGVTSHETSSSEAEEMLTHIIGNYPESDNTFILEDEALDTLGNGIFTHEKLKEYPEITKLHIVTSCYHLHRSQFIFARSFSNDYLTIVEECFDCDSNNATMEQQKLAEAHEFFRRAEESGTSYMDALLETEIYLGKKVY